MIPVASLVELHVHDVRSGRYRGYGLRLLTKGAGWQSIEAKACIVGAHPKDYFLFITNETFLFMAAVARYHLRHLRLLVFAPALKELALYTGHPIA